MEGERQNEEQPKITTEQVEACKSLDGPLGIFKKDPSGKFGKQKGFCESPEMRKAKIDYDAEKAQKRRDGVGRLFGK